MQLAVIIFGAAFAVLFGRILARIYWWAWQEDVEEATKQDLKLSFTQRLCVREMLFENTRGYSRVERFIDIVSVIAFVIALVVAIF